ncbi:hypothetical protein FJN13_02140 [Alteromonas mediterranea]|uniref:hypothetical protein n=1 Tax=Alteromonas mediterranea TaxID=314275 RepID=UPI000903704C|nr:hypothetical protein [Alteromonas mediterranea]APE00827.1 hypothetical protein BM526_02505 [Alteromonas mediterranea]QDG33670.1 hypothetical protein FJN13_02140 [Alteromonas mediterranea]
MDRKKYNIVASIIMSCVLFYVGTDALLEGKIGLRWFSGIDEELTPIFFYFHIFVVFVLGIIFGWNAVALFIEKERT